MKTKHQAVLTLVCLLASSGAYAASWNISTEYSATSNPSGVWSYGRKYSVNATAMDLFTVRWSDSGWYLGNVGNGGPSVYAGPHMWAKANATGYPCTRWTCPMTGRYNIRGRFLGDDSRGVDNFVYVVINGSTTFSNRVQAYLQAVTFTNDNVSLIQGDVVDFTLVWGGGVFSEYGWTDVDAVISEAQPDRPTLDIRVSQVELCWQTASNAWYQLQYRSTLTTNQWAPLGGAWITGDGTRYCTNDTVLVGQPQRYYQVAATNSPPQP